MRIAIDGRWVRSARLDGIGRVTTELVRAFLAAEAPDVTVILLYHDPAILDFLRGTVKRHADRLELRRLDYPVLSGRDLVRLRHDAAKLNLDVFFSANFLSWPFSRSYRTVVMVHDLIPNLYAEARRAWKWRLFFGRPFPTRLLLGRADCVVTGSESTRKDLERHLKVEADRVAVIPYGVDQRFFDTKTKSELEDVRRRLGLPLRFILSVGRQEPYKNIQRLIAAHATLAATDPDLYLVLTGAEHLRFKDDLEQGREGSAHRSRIQFTGYVSDEDLPAVYQLATVFCMPSLCEGFGLPLLEAMASGTAVACSNCSSMPEVAGEAGTFFDPSDVVSLTAALARLLSDERSRAELGQIGRARAALFTWRRTGEALLNLFRSLGT